MLFKRDSNPNFNLISNDVSQGKISHIFGQMVQFLSQFDYVRLDKFIRRSKNYLDELFSVLLGFLQGQIQNLKTDDLEGIRSVYQEFQKYFCFRFEPKGYWIFNKSTSTSSNIKFEHQFFIGNILRTVFLKALQKFPPSEIQNKKTFLDKYIQNQLNIQIDHNLIKFSSEIVFIKTPGPSKLSKLSSQVDQKIDKSKILFSFQNFYTNWMQDYTLNNFNFIVESNLLNTRSSFLEFIEAALETMKVQFNLDKNIKFCVRSMVNLILMKLGRCFR